MFRSRITNNDKAKDRKVDVIVITYIDYMLLAIYDLGFKQYTL